MTLENVQIPKADNYNLPAGDYAAILADLRKHTKQKGKKSQQWVRFLFEVAIPGLSKFRNMAGRSFVFDLNQGSDLRNFLTSLLGAEYFNEHSGQEVDLTTLIGSECIITLAHLKGPKFDKPFVLVENAELIPKAKGATV